MLKPPRIHLVLVPEKSLTKEFSFQELCTRTDCPDKGIKVCPHSLVVDGKPVWNFTDFLDAFSRKHELLSPCLTHITIGDKKDAPLGYLIFFAEKCGFHERASEIIKSTACFDPFYTSCGRGL